jgi:signal transduction histidine kinase/ActR/RegA family two-component response regulator
LLVAGFAVGLGNAGVAAGGGYLALLLLPIVLAGVILPRVWLLIATVGTIAAAALADRLGPYGPAAGSTEGFANFLYATVLVAAVVDQFGGTVRSAFLHAVAHEQELETARADLQSRTAALQEAVAALETEMAERQRMEAERRAMEERAIESQKLESLGLLAGGIAHDFNNLLVGMMGNAGLALLELPADAPGRDRIAQVEGAARRAADLARQMLAYSGKGQFMVAPIDLTVLVREMTQLLRASIPRSIEVRYALAAQPAIIEGDATQLRQVVMNLVVNASDAIGDRSGTISVATGHIHADRSYLATTFLDEGLAEGDYAFLEVTDTGSGMDAATQTRIFEPFFTTKTSGRGLGLAAVLGIVRGHHGALKVYSEPGGGSRFRLLLPSTQATAAADPWANPSPKPWHGTGTVLVVDDEPMVRDVARAILQRLGLDVILAESGDEAVRLFAADPGGFALVLLDLTMPGLSGADTFREIRSLRPDAAVVLMSGYSAEEAGGRFVGKGLAGFVEKPFSTQGLVNAIQGLIEARPDTQG